MKKRLKTKEEDISFQEIGYKEKIIKFSDTYLVDDHLIKKWRKTFLKQAGLDIVMDFDDCVPVFFDPMTIELK